jgi:VCBS repeat-containing protein
VPAGLTGITAIAAGGDHSLAAWAIDVDDDADGVAGPVEDGAPNDGDGNADGVPDRDQENVASLPNAVDGEYVTIESPTGTQLIGVEAVVPAEDPPDTIEVPYGLTSYAIEGLALGEAVIVTQYLPPNPEIDDYWKYGPTPVDPSDHWYQFMFDGTTGAVITHEADRTVIVLHYVDGQRGDADLTADGRVVDPGGPAIILNQPPVAVDDDYATGEDTPLTIDAPGVLANDTDEDGNPITAVLVHDADHGELSLNADGSFSYTPDLDWFGDDTFTYKANDGELESGEATVTIEVQPVNDLPNGTATPSEQTTQYSDPIVSITIDADDIDSSTVSAAATGLPEGVVMAGSSCDVPCAFTIGGTVTDAAGTYVATISLNDGTDTTDVTVTIIVEPEDAAVVFDGANEVAFHVDEAGGTGSVELAVLVREAFPDLPEGSAAPGDIGKTEVTMTLVPVGPGSSVNGVCLPGDVVGTGYDAVLAVTCTFADVEVNTYTAEAAVIGGYYVSPTIEDVVVVYDPSLGFTTGGGWFYWPGTTDKTNFGYTMKYNKKGQKVKGSLLLIRHLEDGSIFRVKSNALYGLALGDGEGFGWATFSGKATYLEPGMPEPEGNHEFVLYVEDYGEPGSGVDQVWLEMRDKAGIVIPALSMPRPAIVNSTTISGGNIVVPH